MTYDPTIDRSAHPNWRPIEIVAVVIGFMINAALGMVLLLWRLWKHFGSPKPGGDLTSLVRSFGTKASDFGQWPSAVGGNEAFEHYKREALERLELERRKLQDEEREFTQFLRELRRAKDKEEFDRFMASRSSSSAR